jgi:hypothetical protein
VTEHLADPLSPPLHQPHGQCREEDEHEAALGLGGPMIDADYQDQGSSSLLEGAAGSGGRL